MPSITSWTRLETRARSEELHSGLQAKIHDPLWLLARQWQLGEFMGEDAGSPVKAKIQCEVSPLSTYHPGPIVAETEPAGQPYDSASIPLEVVVEREKVVSENPESDFRLSARAGQQFLRFVKGEQADKYVTAYVEHYSLQATNPGQGVLADSGKSFLLVMSNRVPDGLRLYDDLRSLKQQGSATLDSLPVEPAIAPEDQINVLRAANKWLSWFESFYSEPATDQIAWLSDRMEYGFAISARNHEADIVLESSEYFDGHLDWYAFNLGHNATIGAGNNRASQTVRRSVIPAPVSYRGMPASRWWEFEDAQVDFGAVEAASEDLAQLHLIEFGLVYGNDWFVIPIEIAVGSLSRIHSLVVTDSFGQRLLIRPYQDVDPPDCPWRLFCITGERHSRDAAVQGNANLLFIPPAMGWGMRGTPLEEVLLLRDETANMAWAVERIVQDRTGRSVNRFEAYQERPSTVVTQDLGEETDDALTYRLTTPVPDYWFPLVPVRDKVTGQIHLRRGVLLTNAEERPFGRILAPNQALRVPDEEVPRAGARITRSFQYARWVDGSTHLWIGRRKSPGRGEGWSGLRFDIAEAKRPG